MGADHVWLPGQRKKNPWIIGFSGTAGSSATTQKAFFGSSFSSSCPFYMFKTLWLFFFKKKPLEDLTGNIGTELKVLKFYPGLTITNLITHMSIS